jgi:hypothetical protein
MMGLRRTLSDSAPNIGTADEAQNAYRLGGKGFPKRQAELRGGKGRHVIELDCSGCRDADAHHCFTEMGRKNGAEASLLAGNCTRLHEGFGLVEVAADVDSDGSDNEAKQEWDAPAPAVHCLGRKPAGHGSAHKRPRAVPRPGRPSAMTHKSRGGWQARF